MNSPSIYSAENENISQVSFFLTFSQNKKGNAMITPSATAITIRNNNRKIKFFSLSNGRNSVAFTIHDVDARCRTLAYINIYRNFLLVFLIEWNNGISDKNTKKAFLSEEKENAVSNPETMGQSKFIYTPL